MRFTFETKLFLGLFLTVALTVSFIVYAVQEPGREDRAEEKFTRESMERGARIFVGATISEVNCMLCHGLRGEGTLGQGLVGQPLNPEFRAQEDLGELDRNVAIETIAFGRAGTGMQEWGSKLKDSQLRDVATFVANWDQEILDEALSEKTAVSVFQSLNQAAPEGMTVDLIDKAEDFEERLAEALLEHDAPVLTVEDEAALVETLVSILRQQGPKNIDKLVAGALEEVLGVVVVKPTPTPTQPVEETPTAAAEETPVAEPTQVEVVLVGDPEAGRQLFISLGCTACHTISSIPEAIGVLGPNQDDVATRAATRVEGLSAEEYIRQSILDPSAFVVSGFPDFVMPQDYGTRLSEKELNDLIAYLLTLE